MNTIFNMSILHFKYTFDFVLGILLLELVAKSLVSVICGVFHIPDFWCKLSLHGEDESTISDYSNKRGFDYYEDKITYAGKSSQDIESRLKGYK